MAALAMVPAGETTVQFSNLAHAKQRWGLSAVNGSTPSTDPQAKALLSKMINSSAVSQLDAYDQVLADNGWSGLDVDWSVSFTASGPPITIYRFRDSLSMSTITDSFVKDGMTRSGSADRPRFTAKSLGSGTYGRIFLSGVTVVPAQHLMIAGPDTVLPADGQGLADDPMAKTLIADVAESDSAILTLGSAACQDPLTGSGTLSAEQLKSLRSEYHLDELQPITGAVATATDDQHGLVVTSYPDAAKADSDLALRKKLLSADSVATKSPYTQLFSASTAVSGSEIRYQLTFTKSPVILQQLVMRRDAPWAFC